MNRHPVQQTAWRGQRKKTSRRQCTNAAVVVQHEKNGVIKKRCIDPSTFSFRNGGSFIMCNLLTKYLIIFELCLPLHFLFFTIFSVLSHKSAADNETRSKRQNKTDTFSKSYMVSISRCPIRFQMRLRTSITISVHLPSVCPSICPSVRPSTRLFVCLSFCWSVCPSIYLSSGHAIVKNREGGGLHHHQQKFMIFSLGRDPPLLIEYYLQALLLGILDKSYCARAQERKWGKRKMKEQKKKEKRKKRIWKKKD